MKKESLSEKLRAYWASFAVCQQKNTYGFDDNGRSERLEQRTREVRALADQDATAFHFRDWYLIHLVFPKDLVVYQKLVATAEAPHEKLYVIVVGITLVDPHFGLQWKTHSELSAFQDAILFPEIERYRKFESLEALSISEHGCAVRLVKASMLNREIERCASAWLLSAKTSHENRHQYPIRRL